MVAYAPLAAQGMTFAEAAAVLGMKRQTLTKYVNQHAPTVGWKPPQLPVWKAAAPSRSSAVGRGKKIFVLPDVQAKPGVDFSYLRRLGQYVLDKRPDVVVCIGDFADMCSLSSYDKGRRGYEGRRYRTDIVASHAAMTAFMGPINEHNSAAAVPYEPDQELFLGNHEFRIERATQVDPMLDGTLSIGDLKYEEAGWRVRDFLEVGVIEGVAFSHYFVTGVAGRAASTAAAMLRKTNMSCVAGHQQGRQIAYATRADGSTLTSIIAGSCYEHNEDYLGPQGNKHWRGAFMMHEVRGGSFDEMWLSLDYINDKYAHLSL